MEASGLGSSGLGASDLEAPDLEASGLEVPGLGFSGLGASDLEAPDLEASGLEVPGLGFSGLGVSTFGLAAGFAADWKAEEVGLNHAGFKGCAASTRGLDFVNIVPSAKMRGMPSYRANGWSGGLSGYLNHVRSLANHSCLTHDSLPGTSGFQ